MASLHQQVLDDVDHVNISPHHLEIDNFAIAVLSLAVAVLSQIHEVQPKVIQFTNIIVQQKKKKKKKKKDLLIEQGS